MIENSMRDEPDYYEILQVSTKAEPGIIDVAYRKLARRYHPDINPSSAAHARMRELNQALDILSDPLKRADYDRRRMRFLAQREMATKPLTLIVPADYEEKRPGVGERLRRPPFAGLAIAAAVGITLVATAFMAMQLVSDAGGGTRSSAESGGAATPVVAAASMAPSGTTDGEPTEEAGSFSDGTWLVGEEITPGIWRATPSKTCSWERLASTEGDGDAIASGSYLAVEILPSDAAFSSEGCGWWTQALTARSASPGDPFGDGTWLVGEEIAPGFWQNSDGSAACTWTRLQRLDGVRSARNENGGQSIITVEITEKNRAFDSRGCGRWTRVGE